MRGVNQYKKDASSRTRESVLKQIHSMIFWIRPFSRATGIPFFLALGPLLKGEFQPDRLARLPSGVTPAKKSGNQALVPGFLFSESCCRKCSFKPIMASWSPSDMIPQDITMVASDGFLFITVLPRNRFWPDADEASGAWFFSGNWPESPLPFRGNGLSVISKTRFSSGGSRFSFSLSSGRSRKGLSVSSYRQKPAQVCR